MRIVLCALLIGLISCATGTKEETIFSQVLAQQISPEEKAELLLNEMTLQEKVTFLRGQDWKHQGYIPRLGLPIVKMQDAGMGVSFWGTSFPSSLTVASTWNRESMKKLSKAVALEGIARGERVILGPGCNIYRMPTTGRNSEYVGEDPYLASEMTSVYIEEMQKHGVISVVKHFIGNNQDFDRHGVSSNIDERTMREIYLPAFDAAVKAGVGGVMVGYNPVNGFPMSENSALVSDLLKKEWGFKGFVVSDWHSIYSTEGPFISGVDIEMPDDSKYFTYHRIKNLDIPNKMEILDDKIRRVLTTYFRIGIYDTPAHYQNLEENPKEHDELAQSLAEEGIVLLKNEDNILPIPQDEKKLVALVGYNSRYLNTTTVGACTVFVRRPGRLISVNALDGFKPYRDDDTKIVQTTMADVATLKKADVVIYFVGLWCFGEGEANDRSWDIKPRHLKQIEKLKSLNKNIVVVNNFTAGIEADSWIDGIKGFIHLGMAGRWADRALARVIFGDVNPSGKLIYTMARKWEDHAPVAAQLNNPDKLVTWPRDAKFPKTPMLGTGRFKVFGGKASMLKSDNLHIYEGKAEAYDKMDHMDYLEGRYLGYRHNDKYNISAHFPFGFGLSYTNFELGQLNVSKNSFSRGEGVTVSVSVTNTGKVAGAEVVQLYVHDPVSRLDRVYKELKGFDKVFLNPGETKRVSISLTDESFQYYDDTKHDWVVESGDFVLLVGNSAENLPLKATVTLR